MNKQASVIRYEHNKETGIYKVYFINGKDKVFFGAYKNFTEANKAVINRKKAEF